MHFSYSSTWEKSRMKIVHAGWWCFSYSRAHTKGKSVLSRTVAPKSFSIFSRCLLFTLSPGTRYMCKNLWTEIVNVCCTKIFISFFVSVYIPRIAHFILCDWSFARLHHDDSLSLSRTLFLPFSFSVFVPIGSARTSCTSIWCAIFKLKKFKRRLFLWLLSLI